ncbi:MAG: N-acetyl-gamma-glutamyl-phosphate reductase [Actinomycetota bacterium]|nr:N-acetyl-gamma-glutamyl-phosphate reductase [Actinomycetota bacterium]
MKKVIKAGIIGGSGFTGLEMIKILSRHKNTELSFATSRKYKNMDVTKVFPSYKDAGGETSIAFIEKPLEENYREIDILFLCLPPHKSMEYLKNIKGSYDFKVIDVGSDFRLKNPDDYRYWYGVKHLMKNKLSEFVYGLPEVNKEDIKKSRYVSNPGCYPTSVLLSIAPVIKGGIDIKDIYIDSKSGVTGAGRKLSDKYLFTNIENNFYAYSPEGHRHTGEIEQEMENMSGKKFKVSFTPHILPVNRGIFTSVYCSLEKDSKESDIGGEVYGLFDDFCSELPFVKFVGNDIPQLKDVIGTNMCLVSCSFDGRTGTLKIFSVIDNLIKGAAGQAVQNMNLMMGFDEAEGLNFNGLFS